MLYPQAIQIGRLLNGSGVELATLSGKFSGVATGPKGSDFGHHVRFVKRLEVAHQARLKGMAHRLAMRLVPLYGRSPDEFVPWSQSAAQEAGAWMASNPGAVDVLASFGEPMSDHLVGLSLKRRFGLPWLAHFSDPWSDNPFRSFQPMSNWCNRRMEGEVIEAADRVVFTSEETRQLVMAKYPASWLDKAQVLPHSFDPADFVQMARGPVRTTVTVRYLGNFYGHRTPFPLFAALARLHASRPDVLTDVCFELIGSTPDWMRWHPAVKRLPEGLLKFCDPVPYQCSLELMRDADLLLVIDAPALHSVFLPSKLVDYIGAAKPIFGIVPPGASHELIARLGGAIANPQAPAAIDAALVQALANARSAKVSQAPWGQAEVRAEFTIERVAGSFRRMLESTRSRSAA